MHQKFVRIQISHQELLKKMLIIFTDILHATFNNLNYQSEYPSILNWQISLMSLKEVTGVLRKTLDQSAAFKHPNKL